MAGLDVPFLATSDMVQYFPRDKKGSDLHAKNCCWLAAVLFACGLAPGTVSAATDDDTPAPLAQVTPEQALVIDALVATVNGEPIFVKDIIRPIHAELQGVARRSTSLRQFKEEVRFAIEKQMRTMVGEIILYSEAHKTLTEDDQKKIDLYMNRQKNELLSQYRGSRALADQALRTKGSSFDKELERKRRKVVVESYMHKQLYPKITVTRRDILRDYESNLEKYTQQAEVDLYTISIPIRKHIPKIARADGKMVTNPNPTAAELRKAEADTLAEALGVCEQLKKGGDFAEFAEKLSRDPKRTEGGRWPHLKRGTLEREDIENKAFATPENTLADPFLSPSKDPLDACVVVLKVGKVVPHRVKAFGEVQREIDMALRSKQYNELSAAYYARLYANAPIDRKDRVDEMLVTATEVVVARYAVK